MGAASQRRQQRSQFWSAWKQSDALVVFKQGQLVKQSKHLKQWRSRTVVLVQRFLVTLEHDSAPPTAVIPLTDMLSLARDDDRGHFLLSITTKAQQEFRFRTRSEEQRDEWFAKIRTEKMRMLKESKVSSSIREEQRPNRLTFVEEEEGVAA